jgi:hypothetical protein
VNSEIAYDKRMRKKPFIFTLVSILCLIEPVFKILYFKATTGFDFSTILSNLLTRQSFFEVIDFWLIYPIAGIMILKLRKLNYYSFMGILVYIFYSIMTYEKYTWPYNSDTPFIYNYVVTLLSFGIFIYFLLPSTRRPFFDARVRWWEPMVRYNVQLPCFLSRGDLSFQGHILNISKSGVFIKDNSEVEVGDKIHLDLSAMGHNISLNIVVMNKHAMHGQLGFGAKFEFASLSERFRIRRLIAHIKDSQTQARPKLSQV